VNDGTAMRDGSKPRILVAQIGARRNYAVPIVLHRGGLLHALVTDITAGDFVSRVLRWMGGIVPSKKLKQLQDRRPREIPLERIVSLAYFGLWRAIRGRCVSSPGARRRFYALQNKRFCEAVHKLKVLKDCDAVYVFNGAGVEIARTAKELGIRVILDQTAAPISVEEELLAEERSRWPGWEPDACQPEDWAQLARREEEEWQLADLIICGSEYVHRCLVERGAKTQKCLVVPTAAAEHFSPLAEASRQNKGLTALFAGTLCLRKGIPYFVQAAKALHGMVRFVAVGGNGLTRYGLNEAQRWVEYQGFVPRSQMPRIYAAADVFVLPSISEGSAAVCYEALASGLPVITTPNAGSVVRDGEEGFIVPLRDVDQLVARICSLSNSPYDRDRFRASAVARAQEFTWDFYQARLCRAIYTCFDRS